LFGPVYDFGTTFNLDKSQEETRRDLFIIPTLASLLSDPMDSYQLLLSAGCSMSLKATVHFVPSYHPT
jgi:hypothetical protein